MMTVSATNPKSTQEISCSLAIGALGISLLRFATSLVWLVLAVVTPIITTLLAGAALVGIGLVLFFHGLLHAPMFQTSTVLAIAALSALVAALLNLLVNWLEPR